MIASRSHCNDEERTAMAITSDRSTGAMRSKGAAGPVRLGGGKFAGIPATGQVVSVAGLEGITLTEPARCTGSEPGRTAGGRDRKTLFRRDHRLAFSRAPMDMRLLGTTQRPHRASWRQTISGRAASLSGPRGDFLLGVRFVRRARAV